MSSVLQTAESIARSAHEKQRYSNGQPYIEAHILPVVGMIARLGYGELYQATGWLHDVTEDTPWTGDDLLRQGIPPDVVNAIDAVSKREGETQSASLGRISLTPLAIVAKFADSSVNFASTVLLSPDLDNDEYKRWVEKYTRNIAYLKPLLPGRVKIPPPAPIPMLQSRRLAVVEELPVLTEPRGLFSRFRRPDR
jgi:hypothetical protein